MADICTCGHSEYEHTDWWDSSENGGGCGLGCRACGCDDFTNREEA